MADIRNELKQLAHSYGFRLVRSKRHSIFRNADGLTVVCASSPSDKLRCLKNFEKDIKGVLTRNNSVLRHNSKA